MRNNFFKPYVWLFGLQAMLPGVHFVLLKWRFGNIAKGANERPHARHKRPLSALFADAELSHAYAERCTDGLFEGNRNFHTQFGVFPNERKKVRHDSSKCGILVMEESQCTQKRARHVLPSLSYQLCKLV